MLYYTFIHVHIHMHSRAPQLPAGGAAGASGAPPQAPGGTSREGASLSGGHRLVLKIDKPRILSILLSHLIYFLLAIC